MVNDYVMLCMWMEFDHGIVVFTSTSIFKISLCKVEEYDQYDYTGLRSAVLQDGKYKVIISSLLPLKECGWSLEESGRKQTNL